MPVVMNKLSRVIDSIVVRVGIIGGLCALALGFVMVNDVFLRYVFRKPTIWAFETSIYLFVAFVLLGMTYVQKTDRNIKVDLLISRLSPRTRAFWDAVTMSVSLVYVVILSYYGMHYFLESLARQETSISFWSPPLWPVKLLIPVGASLLSIQYIKDIVTKVHTLRTGSLERGTGIWNSPIFLGSVFAVLIAPCLLLYRTQPIIAFVALMLVLLAAGVHIFTALGLAGAIGLFVVFGGSPALSTVPHVTFGALNRFTICSLPMFILTAHLMFKVGAGEDLFNMCTAWLGRIPGSLGMATIFSCAIFAAISASSVATALTIGLIAIPALLAKNYPRPLTYGMIAAGGTLGIMIPPAGSMIIYSAVTEESLGKLFMAGVIPGFLTAGLFMVYVFLVTKFKHKMQTATGTATSWRAKFGAIYKAKWVLVAPIIILGGIYSGVFTPTEAGSVAGVYALFMALGRRKLKVSEIPGVMLNTTVSSIGILVIIAGALVMGNYMTMLNIPQRAIELVMSSGLSRWGVMGLLAVIYLIMGMFLEIVSIMMITLPVVYPLIIFLGFNGIWFAVAVTLLMEIALITPPVGLNLFVIQGMTEAPLGEILRGVLPFFLLMLLMVLIIAAFPALSTWLPSVMVG